MPPQPRGRACQSCQSIKIKCELGAYGGEPPCERCTRLNKECTLAVPKRQKDRVAELEAKVEALTKLLGSQGLQDASIEARDHQHTNVLPQGDRKRDQAVQKKRKLDSSIKQSSRYESSGDVDDPTEDPDWLSELLSIDMQQRILQEFVASYHPIFPVVPMSLGATARTMSKNMPHTLHAAIYIASAGILSWDLQDKINLALIEDLTTATIVKCQNSLDLLQALQIVCLWYRSPRNSTQIPLFQLVNIASEMAVNLGFGGSHYPPALSIAGFAAAMTDTVDAQRRWLVSFIVSETTSLLKRRPNEQKWTPHHDHCLEQIEANGNAMEGDHILTQHVRATRLLATISQIMALNVEAVSPTLGAPECQRSLHDLQTQINSFRLEVPLDCWSPALTFTGFFMEVLLYEVVLQTPTNKGSFAAPFLIERLSAVDVPTPVLTQSHFEAVHSLKTACHNLLDTAAALTGPEIVTLPTMIYAPRVAHTVVILMRLHIAVTVQGSTYGAILSPDDLKLELYLDKCIEMMVLGSKIEREAVMVRILQYMHQFKEWLHMYESSRLDAERHMEDNSGFGGMPNAKGATLANRHACEQTKVEPFSELSNQWQDTQKLDMDAPFADFVNSEFAMDDLGLFELFSGTDYSASPFDF